MAEIMENFTIRLSPLTRTKLEQAARKDKRRPGEWARVKLEEALEGILGDDDTSDDVTLTDDIEGLIRRGWLSRAGWEHDKSEDVQEKHRRAQELLDQGKQWW